MFLRLEGSRLKDCKKAKDPFSLLKKEKQQRYPIQLHSCLLEQLPAKLASRAVLFAFISARQNVLLTEHWLKHYQRLQVRFCGCSRPAV